MKIGYYVVLQREHRHVFLAGPFADEATADKYLPDAVTLAHQMPHWGWFDDHAVMRIEQEYMPLGKLNDHLTIDPADLVKETN